MSLSARRHHEERMKRRVSYYYDRLHDPRSIGKRAHTRQPCSCYMCGNPRHFGEPPIQERDMGREILAGIEEIKAWRRGEIELLSNA